MYYSIPWDPIFPATPRPPIIPAAPTEEERHRQTQTEAVRLVSPGPLKKKGQPTIKIPAARPPSWVPHFHLAFTAYFTVDQVKSASG